jgi:hypothetical protein
VCLPDSSFIPAWQFLRVVAALPELLMLLLPYHLTEMLL